MKFLWLYMNPHASGILILSKRFSDVAKDQKEKMRKGTGTKRGVRDEM